MKIPQFKSFPLMIIAALLSCATGGGSSASYGSAESKHITVSTTSADWTEPAGMTIVWSDEFNGTSINTSAWSYETEATGWSKSWNNELQNYVDNGTGGDNAYIESGSLVIKAIESSGTYTSARMVTKNKGSWKHGSIAAKMKLPYGQGIWPAFWMLPSSGNWPDAGEIDVVELIGGGSGRDNKAYGTLHGPGYSGGSGIQGSATLAAGNYSDNYHVFEIRWDEGFIEWYIDGVFFQRVTKDSVPGSWVFDSRNFYILFNLAVGGGWPGNPDGSTVFPQKMYIDWVRVYQ